LGAARKGDQAARRKAGSKMEGSGRKKHSTWWPPGRGNQKRYDFYCSENPSILRPWGSPEEKTLQSETFKTKARGYEKPARVKT